MGFASCVLDSGAKELGSLYSPVGGNILLVPAEALLRIEAARDGLECVFGTEDDLAPEPVFTVRCAPPPRGRS